MKTKLLLMFLFLTITLQAQTNLVPNGNFENWTSSSQPDNWFKFSNGLVSQNAMAQNGSSSAKMQIKAGIFNFMNSELFPVVAGKTYRVSMYHKLVSGSFSDIRLTLYHKPGTFKEEITNKSDDIFSSTEWRKIEFDFTPTVSENIEIEIFNSGNGDSEILVDNVSVIDVATLGPQYTLIPDINFETKLISLGIDSGTTDGKVLTSKVASLTSLNVSNSSITNLTGIEDFIALKTLNCSNNRLTQVNVSKNILLTTLECNNNQLNALELSFNPMLLAVELSNNNIFNINFSNNTKLKSIRCYNNFISNINVSKQLALESLDFGFNRVENIDLSFNVNLQSLLCNNNRLKSLDLSKNNKLTILDAIINNLISLNIKNGANYLFNNPGSSIRFNYNEYLSCIQVDNVDDANAHWSSQKNPEARFSTDCYSTLIPDINFETKLISLGIDSGAPDGKVLTTNIASLTYLNVANSSIIDLTGIEDFKKLTVLYASKNQITTLNLSDANINLTSLTVSENKLKSINVRANVLLTSLSIDNNELTTLDVSQNTKLTSLNVRENKLKSINVRANVLLTSLSIDNNELTTLDVSQNTKLNEINADNNQLTALDLSNNLQLKQVVVSDNQLTALDLSKNNAITFLQCYSNKLTSLDISNASLLTSLNCHNNQLTALDVLDSILLKSITCQNNSLLSLDVTKNTNLEYLNSSSNKLTSLDLTKNLKIETLYCWSNQLTTLDVSNNKLLINLYVYDNSLTTIDVSNNTLLTRLYVYKNYLTDIDVSKNAELTYFFCFNNQLTSLDITNNKKIKGLRVNLNNLTSLNLKNGNNTIFDTLYTNFNDNPNLSCIQVDSKTYADANWSSSKDTNASYSESCANLSTSDIVFEKLSVYPNPTKGALFIDNVSLSKVVVYDALGKIMNVPFSSNGTSTTANLEQFPKGIYYMYIESEGETTVRKVIVE